MATQVGGIYYDARIDTSQIKRDASVVDSTVKGVGDSGERSAGIATRGFQNLAKVGMGAVIAAAAAAGYAIISNIGNAVERVDTLNNFPKVMANLGYGADEASSAMKRLDLGVRGLPTSLSDIAGAMQNIAPAAGSLSRATDITLALNNALLAGGKSAALQSTAMDQFSQAIARGKPDMMEWRTLATTMPGQLDQITQSLGYGRGEWQRMAEDIANGKRPFSDVTDAMVRLNQDGLGQFPSFAQQAKNATGGIGTAFANMNTAITRGLAGVINAMQPGLTNAIINVGKGFETVLKSIVSIINFFKEHEVAAAALAGALAGLGVAIFVALIPAMITLAGAIGAAVIAAAPFIIAGAAIAAIAYLIMSNWGSISAFFTNLWTTISSAFTAGVAWIVSSFNSVVSFIGSIPGRIGAAISAIVQWFSTLPERIAYFLAFLVGRLIRFYLVDIPNFVTGIVTWLSQLPGRIASIFMNVHSTISTWVGNAILIAIHWFSQLPGRVWGFISGIPGTVSGVFNSVRNAMSNAISSGITAVVGFFQQLPGRLLGAVSGLAGQIYNKLRDIASSAWKGFKDGLGIKSPSYIERAFMAISDQGQTTIADMKNATRVLNSTAPKLPSAATAGLSTINGLSDPLGGPGGSPIENHIGTINISSDVDGEKWLKRLGRDDEITARGLVAG